jgi:hypothetical protein
LLRLAASEAGGGLLGAAHAAAQRETGRANSRHTLVTGAAKRPIPKALAVATELLLLHRSKAVDQAQS